MNNSNGGGSFTTGFLIGAIVGAVAGILLAPKSGLETRAQLMEQSETWRAKAEEAAASLRERVGPTVDEIRERVAPVAERVGLGQIAKAANGGGSASDAAKTKDAT